MRNVGTALGYTFLAYQSLHEFLEKVEPNGKAMREELEAHYEVLGEAVQTVLRKYRVKNAYEILKHATRGKG